MGDTVRRLGPDEGRLLRALRLRALADSPRAFGATLALWGMWVEPAARGSGVAAALVEAVRGWAVAAGARRLRLGVVADGASAIRFYQRLGFRREGAQRAMQRDPTQSWFEMYRPV